jgi:predicted DNA-binding transcriptional regulator AlpA
MTENTPPWVDMDTLSWAICTSLTSIENYVAQGLLPLPHKLGGKRLWCWKEVEEWLTNGGGNVHMAALSGVCLPLSRQQAD